MHDDSRDVYEPWQVEQRLPEMPKSLPERMGLSPRFLALGEEAGYDMHSLAGIAAWSIEFKRRVMASEPVETTVPKAGTPPNSPTAPTAATPKKDSAPASSRSVRERSTR